MEVMFSVASFGLVPMPPVSFARGQFHLGVTSSRAAIARSVCGANGERLATQAELAELDLQLRRAQPETRHQHA
jgi:hypothetical protein